MSEGVLWFAKLATSPWDGQGDRLAPLLMLLGGATGLLVASASLASLNRQNDEPNPRKRSLLAWLPIASAFAMAMALGEPAAALSLAYSASIVLLSLVGGLLLLLGPLSRVPEPWAGAWLLSAPLAMVGFFAGFRRGMGGFDATALAVMGGLVLWQCWTPQRPTRDEPSLFGFDVPRGGARGAEILLVAGSIALALTAAAAALRGAAGLAAMDQIGSAHALTPVTVPRRMQSSA